MKRVARLSEKERSELFTETASKMGITAAAVEKDFWICWVLLHVFEDEELSQYLRFKGGTSLSKCFNAIERFSEDIDLILDWTKLTEENPEETRSKTKQGKLNQAINEQSHIFISDKLIPRLIDLMGDICELAIDNEDPHTINITYPKAFLSQYLRPQVRLEIGPLAAMLPMDKRDVQPYAAQHFPDVFQQVSAFTPTISVARTFWEKLTILHAEAHRPKEKPIPSRYARHYYDVYKLIDTGLYKLALEQCELLDDVVVFKQRFYPSGWANYDSATFDGLLLLPSKHHRDSLKADYKQMQEMFFGERPSFEDIEAALFKLQSEVRTLIKN